MLHASLREAQRHQVVLDVDVLAHYPTSIALMGPLLVIKALLEASFSGRVLLVTFSDLVDWFLKSLILVGDQIVFLCHELVLIFEAQQDWVLNVSVLYFLV